MSERRSALMKAGMLALGGGSMLTASQLARADSVSGTNLVNIGTSIKAGATPTEAVKSAVQKISAAGGGCIYFPPGRYPITETIFFSSAVPIDIQGAGSTSVIEWAVNGNLFEWRAPCREVSFKSLKIESTNVAKSRSSSAIHCSAGTERSQFESILFVGPAGSGTFFSSGIRFVGLTDSTSIVNCQFWYITGTGIQIGHGSEVRIVGGRIIGRGLRNDESIGVHLTGGNGGVHLNSVDIIDLQTGLLIQRVDPAKPNREVIITHSSLDSCFRGMSVCDDTYVSMVGCWAASCNHENIHIDAGYPGALLSISGGTIFNAGAFDSSDPNGSNGITVNSGTFTMTGVHVRSNRGRGVWIPNPSVKSYIVSACRVTENGTGLDLSGDNYIVSNCYIGSNVAPSQFGGTNKIISTNITAGR